MYKRQIYSINVLDSDLDSIQGILPSISQSDFIIMVDTVGGYFCLDRSEAFFLSINALPSPIQLESRLCNEEFVILFEDTIRDEGFYVANNATCDSLVELTVVTSDLVIGDLSDSIYFNCETDTIELAALFTSTSDSIAIRWENPISELLGTDSILRIGDVGRYGFRVDDGICGFVEQTEVFDPRDTCLLYTSPSPRD